MGYNSLFTVVPHAMRMIYEEDVDPELKEKPLIAKKYVLNINFKIKIDSIYV